MRKLATSPIARYGFLCLSVIVFAARIHRLWAVFHASSNDFADPFLGAMMLVRHQLPFDVNLAFQKSYEYLPYSRHWHNKLYPILYPPSMLIVLAPLTLLRYGIANVAWFFLSIVLYCSGVFVLIRTLFPKLAWEFGVSFSLLATMPTYFGFNVECDQFAAVLAGLSFMFLACGISGQRELGWVCATVVICMKATFALPILGIYLAQRRYKELTAAVMVALALNVIGFAMIGGIGAVNAFAHSIAIFDHAPTNAVDPRAAHGLDRTDSEYLAMGAVDNLQIAKGLAVLVDVVAVVVIAFFGLRLTRSAGAAATVSALGCPLTILTLTGVYHQVYDLTLLVGAAALACCLLAHHATRWPAILFLTLIGVQSIYDIDRFGPVLAMLHFLPPFFPKIVVSGLLLALLVLSLFVLRDAAEADARRTSNLIAGPFAP